MFPLSLFPLITQCVHSAFDIQGSLGRDKMRTNERKKARVGGEKDWD